MLGQKTSQLIAFFVLIALVIAAPSMLYPVFVMKVLCFALFACAFNLLIGYVGLLSFGHAAFFGLGAYVTAWTAKSWGLTPEIAILLGGVSGAALGTVFGWLAIRRQGLYFAMITLALAQMVYFFCVEAPFTGGEDGIQQVARAQPTSVGWRLACGDRRRAATASCRTAYQSETSVNDYGPWLWPAQ